MRLRWTFGARDDLAAIASYISEDNEAAARRWVSRLRTQAARATRFPRSGRMVPELGRRDVRELLLRGYRIVYVVREEEVLVLTVFEGHRELRVTEAELPDVEG